MLPGLIERGHDPTVGITAHEATITLRISAWAADASGCQAKITATERRIRDALGELVYGEEDDEVEDAALTSLTMAGVTVATIEVGTAGRVAALLAQAAARRPAGAARVYRGGRVVSELPVAPEALLDAAAATAAEQGASVGLAVGPLRPSNERQAVDIAITYAGRREIHEHHLGGGDIALARAAKTAVNMVRRTVATARPSGQRSES
jgi:nicotinamide-nucleotide amidase